MKKMMDIYIAAILLGACSGALAQSPVDNGQREISQSYEKKIKELDGLLSSSDKKMNAARKEFVSIFTEAQEAIMADKLDKAKKPVEKLHKIPHPNKYEESRIYLVDYWYQGKLGNKDAENEAAAKLMEIGVGNVDSDAFVEAGMRLLKRQYNAQNYGGAIETLGNLRKEPKSQAELDTITTAVKKLDDIASTNQDIVQQIKTDDKGKWNAKLIRSTFFLDKINGQVSSIDFDCSNKQASLPYKTESVMSTPEAWGSCSIKVNATPNTTFSFAQIVNKPTA